VREFKKRWESTCREASKSKADLIRTQQSSKASTRPTDDPEDLRPSIQIWSLHETQVDRRSGDFRKLWTVYARRADDSVGGAGRLSRERPKTLEDYGSRQLIYETVSATKVLFPHQTLKTTVPGVRELAVWVVDPLPGAWPNALRTNMIFPRASVPADAALPP